EAKDLADADKVARRREELVAPEVPSRREQRRERRRQAARAVTVAVPTVGPDADETLEDYLARVEAPILPRRPLRRASRVAAVVVLIGACVALPWAAPGVP